MAMSKGTSTQSRHTKRGRGIIKKKINKFLPPFPLRRLTFKLMPAPEHYSVWKISSFRQFSGLTELSQDRAATITKIFYIRARDVIEIHGALILKGI